MITSQSYCVIDGTVLETASGKVSMLKNLLDKEDIKNLRHTLIYTSDKEPGTTQQREPDTA